MFEINKIYTHEQIFKPMRGINVHKSEQKYIILISSPKSVYLDDDANHGDEGFSYIGEGQSGDQTFTRGNKALLEYSSAYAPIYYFKKLKPNKYLFFGDVICKDWSYKDQQIGADGNLRKVIEFTMSLKQKFSSVEWILNINKIFKNDTEESKRILFATLSDKSIGETERKQIISARVGQGKFRQSVAERCNNKCVFSNLDWSSDLMVAGHIKPWSKCNNNVERISGWNGLYLSPLWDELFDKGYCTVYRNGKIIFSNLIIELLHKQLAFIPKKVSDKYVNNNETLRMLDWHNKNIFEKKNKMLQ